MVLDVEPRAQAVIGLSQPPIQGAWHKASLGSDRLPTHRARTPRDRLAGHRAGGQPPGAAVPKNLPRRRAQAPRASMAT